MKQTIRLTESELKNMISESVKRVLKEHLDNDDDYPRLSVEKSRPGDIPPGDEDVYYPCDINPDVWNALQRGDFGEEENSRLSDDFVDGNEYQQSQFFRNYPPSKDLIKSVMETIKKKVSINK